MKEMKLNVIRSCEFKRERDSDWEVGISFNDGAFFMDKHGERLDRVWDVAHTYKFVLELDHIFN